MRKDGKRIKNAEPMYQVAAYIMDKRYDSMNMITLDIPVAPMQQYLRAKHKEGIFISHMGLIIAAYVRAAAEFPALNRFVVNKRIYARNELTVGMVVLQENEGGDENGTMSKIHLELSDTVFDVQRKIDAYIEENRSAATENGTDKMIRSLLKFPGLCRVGVGFFKFLDKHGMLPKSVIDMSPFHISFVITNLASIRTNHIYHHIYEFGTTSMAIAMGNLRLVPRNRGGDVVFEKCLPLGVVMDERICSGSYFARVFAYVSRLLKDPTLLETPPAEIKRDIV